MKYLNKKSNKWIYRILLFLLLIWIFIGIIQVFNSIVANEEISITAILLPTILCIFLANLNSIAYDNSNIYIINYKGTKIYRLEDFDKIKPVISFLNYHWIYFKSNKKYLFYVGSMNIMGSFDSEEIANQMTKDLSI